MRNRGKGSGAGLVILLLFLSSFGKPLAYGEPVRILSQENGSGRTFFYTAKKLGIPVLKATIRIRNGHAEGVRNLYQIEAQVVSLKIPGFMFRMNNRFTSVGEMAPFSPQRYVKEIDQEGLFIKRKKYVHTITFDPDHSKAIVEEKGGGERREVVFPSLTYDPLALFARYHLKENFPLGQEVRMSIFDGIKFRQMTFLSNQVRVKSPLLGEVEAVCLESTTAFSTFGEKEGNLRIWYTAKGDKIPILLELDLPAGMVRFELEEMKEG